MFTPASARARKHAPRRCQDVQGNAGTDAHQTLVQCDSLLKAGGQATASAAAAQRPRLALPGSSRAGGEAHVAAQGPGAVSHTVGALRLHDRVQGFECRARPGRGRRRRATAGRSGSLAHDHLGLVAVEGDTAHGGITEVAGTRVLAER